MGSLSKVNVVYTDLIKFMKATNKKIIGTSLNSKSISDYSFQNFDGIIVFGSESNGISREIKKEINDYISIPKTVSNSSAESLNLSISVAIFLSKIKGI